MATVAPHFSPPPRLLPPSYSYHHLRTRLNAITTVAELQQYHSLLIRLGLSSCPDAAGRLLKFLRPKNACAGDGEDEERLSYALRLVLHHPNPDSFLFNVLLRSLPTSPHLSALLFSLMISLHVLPSTFSFPPLFLSLSSSPLSLTFALQAHALLIKLGPLFHLDSFSQNSLLRLYLSFRLPDAAVRLFHTTSPRDVVSWTTMVGGLAKLGLVDEARSLFDAMPDRNSVSWNAMISGYVVNNRFIDAIKLFEGMIDAGIGINQFVAASVLAACVGLGALEQGEWVHKEMVKSRVVLDTKLATTVIDMYCKCGSVAKAYEVFHSLKDEQRGLSSWNCMIGGFAVHGRGSDAIALFHQMEAAAEVVPDEITLLNVLTACAHSGMIDEGQHYFDYISSRYSIVPRMEHYGCLVDLLGRAGMLQKAKKVIDTMPMEPDAGVLGALLGACRIHGNIELAVQFGYRVIELDPENSGRYVLLANMLAGAGRWQEVAEVRRLMDVRKVSKEAGRSSLVMNGMANEFTCGSRMTHPRSKEIYAMVSEMLERIGEHGYVPDTSGVVYDIAEEEEEEEKKVDAVFHHSEKLAIAFGLLMTKPGATLRVTKNLRVCMDCHEASKLISKVYERDIIVRDRIRFHHFHGGLCSCHDYW